ncbi:MAG: hypothetical protein MUC62_02290 [Candidatus Thermoplasmatota archaeon]|jgi:hypothetical protein|nr:hypothetical protein [Candidatus Thermoplasmatota archaeon]
MRHGDRDGYKVVYDHNGQPMLHPNERKLVVEENVIPTLKSTWRYYGGEYLLEPSKGTIVLTNERLIFINTPERMFAIGGGEEARAMAAASDKTFEIGEGAQGGSVREYFEIPNIEIMASEKKEGAVSVGEMVNVFILSTGNQFHLSMVLPKDSGLLSRLMNKRVQSLDELVNNLKDLFKQTEWMYNEQEKRMIGAGTTAPSSSGAQATQKQSQQTVPTIPGIRAPPVSSKPMTANTDAPTGPSSRPPLDEKGGKQSLVYFENLYKKGLIKEDIYRKLVSQYKEQGPPRPVADKKPTLPPPVPAVPKQKAPMETLQRQSSGHELEDLEVPMDGELEVLSPEAAPEPLGKSDDELLSILDSTLNELGDEPPETPSNASSGNKPMPKRVLRGPTA